MPDPDPIVNCLFPVSGGVVPPEHGYALYGALHQIWPLDTYDWLQIGPIAPLYRRGKYTVVGSDATLLLRAPISQLPLLFTLADITLPIGQGHITLGRPMVTPLAPCPVLESPFVTVKVHKDGGQLYYPWDDLCLSRFVKGVDDRILALGITTGRAHVDHHRPRWLHIKEGGASGYPVAVIGLSDAESLLLQQAGLGGRRKMGCGVMVPWQA